MLDRIGNIAFFNILLVDLNYFYWFGEIFCDAVDCFFYCSIFMAVFLSFLELIVSIKCYFPLPLAGLVAVIVEGCD